VIGKANKNVVNWNDLNMNFAAKAVIDQETCIDCGRCHIACEDTAHQAIKVEAGAGRRLFTVDEEECVGCNLCALTCPVPGCITMRKVENDLPYVTWPNDPRNPSRV